MPRTAFADAKGQFTSTRSGRPVPVDATHEDFLPASYGQKMPGKAGTPVDLADGQRVETQF